MKIILAIVIILFIIGLICIICACIISGKISEEEYRNLDPKVLDDENKDWDIEEMFTYDDEFVKKGKRCRKSNMKSKNIKTITD